MLEKLKTIGDSVLEVLSVIAFLAVGLMFLRILGEMWPMFTGMFFLFVTLGGIGKGNWVMSLGGLTLYIASWPAVDLYGTLIGMTVWFIGFMIWFVAPMVTLPQVKLCPIGHRT